MTVPASNKHVTLIVGAQMEGVLPALGHQNGVLVNEYRGFA
jgi:hypothetical protein